MLYVLVLLFVVLPIVELYVLIQVGHVVGVLPAILLLILVSVLGAALVRREGARAWRAFQSALEEGRMPGREVADGALVLFGGALLLAPGFVTDVFGLVLVLRPTRAVVRKVLLAWAARRVAIAAPAQRVRATRIVEGRALDSRRPRHPEGGDRRGP